MRLYAACQAPASIFSDGAALRAERTGRYLL